MAQPWRVNVEMPLQEQQNESLGVTASPAETMKLKMQPHQDRMELRTEQTTLGMREPSVVLP